MAMAMAAVPEDEALDQDLHCPICLEFLNEPVTLPDCSHSYCKPCLEQTIEGARQSYRNPYTCPQCRRGFSPSQSERVNQHLQSIVDNHRRGQERRAEERRNEDARTPQLEQLNTALFTAEAVVESLVDAVDRVAMRTGNSQQPVPLYSVDSFEGSDDTTPLLPRQQQTADCDFEAETIHQFRDRSIALFRRHFLLIVFIIHASIFVVCLFKAMG